MELFLLIAGIILFIILMLKIGKKLIKVAITFLFVGFIVYLATGTNIIEDIIGYLGFDAITSLLR